MHVRIGLGSIRYKKEKIMTHTAWEYDTTFVWVLDLLLKRSARDGNGLRQRIYAKPHGPISDFTISREIEQRIDRGIHHGLSAQEIFEEILETQEGRPC